MFQVKLLISLLKAKAPPKRPNFRPQDCQANLKKQLFLVGLKPA